MPDDPSETPGTSDSPGTPADRPDFREAKNTLAVVLINEHRYSDAIAVLKPLTEDILYQTPENAWGNLGWAYLQQGSFDLAIDALKRSVAAQPVFCVGSYRLGLAFEHKQELTSALDAFTRALEAFSCATLPSITSIIPPLAASTAKLEASA